MPEVNESLWVIRIHPLEPGSRGNVDLCDGIPLAKRLQPSSGSAQKKFACRKKQKNDENRLRMARNYLLAMFIRHFRCHHVARYHGRLPVVASKLR